MLKLTVEWISHLKCLSVHRHGIITLQAFSEANRKLWLEAMDGKEPVSQWCHLLFAVHSKLTDSVYLCFFGVHNRTENFRATGQRTTICPAFLGSTQPLACNPTCNLFFREISKTNVQSWSWFIIFIIIHLAVFLAPSYWVTSKNMCGVILWSRPFLKNDS